MCRYTTGPLEFPARLRGAPARSRVTSDTVAKRTKRRAPSSLEKRLAQSEASAPRSELRKAAADARMTLRDLAKAAGTSPGSLTAYQHGRPVPERIARKIAKLVGFVGWPGGVR